MKTEPYYVHVTLSIPADLRRDMDLLLRNVNWSEVFANRMRELCDQKKIELELMSGG